MPRRPLRRFGDRPLAGGAVLGLAAARAAAGAVLVPLCLHAAQRTWRPSGGIAPSLSRYCVAQAGQVRIMVANSLSGAVNAGKQDIAAMLGKARRAVRHEAGKG